MPFLVVLRVIIGQILVEFLVTMGTLIGSHMIDLLDSQVTGRAKRHPTTSLFKTVIYVKDKPSKNSVQ